LTSRSNLPTSSTLSYLPCSSSTFEPGLIVSRIAAISSSSPSRAFRRSRSETNWRREVSDVWTVRPICWNRIGLESVPVGARTYPYHLPAVLPSAILRSATHPSTAYTQHINPSQIFHDFQHSFPSKPLAIIVKQFEQLLSARIQLLNHLPDSRPPLPFHLSLL